MANGPDVPELEVNIPIPEGLRVTADRPYRILVVGDFAGSESGQVSGALADRVVDVRADGFDELLSSARPTVNYTMVDPTRSEKKTMVEVNVAFDSLRAFEPRNLIEQIPAAGTCAWAETRPSAPIRSHGR